MDSFDLEIKKEFINEALINLEEAESSFMELESSTDKKALLDRIFRLAHNLKGGSRAVGFGDVAEFTHQLENLVLKIQKGEIDLSSDLVTILLRSNDRLVEMLTELKNDIAATFNNSDLLNELQKWLDGSAVSQETTPATSPEPPIAVPSEITTAEIPSDINVATASEMPALVPEISPEEKKTETPPAADSFDSDLPPTPSAEAFFANGTPEPSPVAEIKPEPPPAPVTAAPAGSQSGGGKSNDGKPKEKEDEIIRVSLSRIDLLNDYVGELIVLQSVIQQQVGLTANTKLHASLRQMVKLSKDIQHLSMSLRMLPAKPLTQKLQRVVRDTAKTLKKEVNFDVVGDQLDIDKSVMDQLSDPLIHILRNAVDHGLETPEDRKKAGKRPDGTVKLSFSNEGNHLVVEVSDDGKGINSEVLKRKAIEKRLISKSQNLSEKQLIHLIFHPGFSTKTETSEISGRGVGMDVVKTNIEKIGGQVDISTQVGNGSLFRLQIPLSLAVIEGLVVVSADNRYVVPLNQVQETINLKTQKIFPSKLGIGSCFELRGNIVPLVNIDDALGLKSVSAIDVTHTALIVNTGEQLMAVVVKDIVRAQQIVIKPLGNGIIQQKGWVGSCVLGDGLPTLIVSLVDLLEGKVSQKLIDKPVGRAA